MADEVADAVVVGAGPNGLVCANVLADAGWDVVVLEAAARPGGAVSSDDSLGPGYVADVCSAFYPLAAVSPPIAALGLEDHGLRWREAPAVLAHPLPDGRAAVLRRDVDATAESLERFAVGDGGAWRSLWDRWQHVSRSLVAAILGPFPPLRALAQMATALGPAGLARFARFATLPVRRLADEEFRGAGAPLLLAGTALHTDLTPEAATGTLYGWLLTMLGHQVGFPVPEGGAGQLTAAMVRRLERAGGVVRCRAPVRRVVVRRGRAVGVVTEAGEEVVARRAVMAGVAATQLYGGLVGWDALPTGLRRDVARFHWDHATVKLDWALRSPVPWTAPEVSEAGTVHLADSLDELTQYGADLAQRRVPARPLVVLGQMTTADPTRSPPGTEVAWAYVHVPRSVVGDAGPDGITGRWGEADRLAIAARIEDRVERYAPGFRRLITARRLLCPADLADHDASLVGGALNGGTSAVHQQVFLRPTPALGRPETPVAHLYLASSSAHPGGGVHGAAGANAARAALHAHRPLGRLVVAPLVTAASRAVRGD